MAKRRSRPNKQMQDSFAAAEPRISELIARRDEQKKLALNAPLARAEALNLDVENLDDSRDPSKVGVLLAEGDSWFDYPGTDVIKALHDTFRYKTDNAAVAGKTLDEMAYRPNALDKLSRMLQDHHDRGDKIYAILLSGGGNDVAGTGFFELLNNASSGQPAFSESMLQAIVEERLQSAYATLLKSVTLLCERQVGRRIPILVHAYAKPVPDKRGLPHGPFNGLISGPWLEPGFSKRGWSNYADNAAFMAKFIDRLYSMLRGVAALAGFEHVHVVPISSQITNDLATYQHWWDNEMHPTPVGFRAVANEFVKVLDTI